MRITVDTSAAERLLQRAPFAINQALEAAMNDAVTDIHAQMQTYPVRPAMQGPALTRGKWNRVAFKTRAGKEVSFDAARADYRRTNMLRASWQKKVSRRGLSLLGEVGSSPNVAPYNIYVQKADRQARIHRGIWTNTDSVVMERSRRRIQEYFNVRIGRAIASLNR